jgi:lysophospholipid acyltransferase (LPLAT)-like uncharacterized protein
MKLRQPWLLRLIGLVAGMFLRWWASTLHRRLIARDGQSHPRGPREQRLIYAFWHESMLAAVAFRARARVLISEHADGELISQVCRHLDLKSIRGSTTRGATRAMLAMMRDRDRRHPAVTPAAPRGPRRQVQLGIVYLASRSGMPIVGVGAGFTCAWRARSWDRFAFPLPWTGLHCVTTRPIFVPPHLNREGLERYRQLVEEEMLRATADAEALAESRRWRKRRPTPPALPGEQRRAA